MVHNLENNLSKILMSHKVKSRNKHKNNKTFPFAQQPLLRAGALSGSSHQVGRLSVCVCVWLGRGQIAFAVSGWLPLAPAD